MSLVELLEKYGYLTILLGTFFEGETILVIAGFAARRGHLALPGVMLAAFAGSLLGDQLAFAVGRRYGERVLTRIPRLRPAVRHARLLLDRYGTPLLLGFRFVYGIRNATPFTAGLSGVHAMRFVPLNVIGAALWAVSVGYAGYVFGEGFELVIARARHYEERVLLILLVLGAAGALINWALRRRRRAAEARQASAGPE